MSDVIKLLTFTLEEKLYALPLEGVERAVRMVEVTPLPKAPEAVSGVINVQGSIIPVVDLRKRFGLPPVEPGPNNQLVISRTPKRRVAIAVDTTVGVEDCPAEAITPSSDISPGVGYIEGVAKLPGGLTLINDLELLLSLSEEEQLTEAMESLKNP